MKLLPIKIKPIKRSGSCNNFSANLADLLVLVLFLSLIRFSVIKAVSELEKNAERKSKTTNIENKKLRGTSCI
jgi:hypothetical protein